MKKLTFLLLASLFFTGMQAQEPEPVQEPILLRDTTYIYNAPYKWSGSYCTLSDGTKLYFGQADMDTTYKSSGCFLLSLYRIESDQPTLNIPADYVYHGLPASLKRVLVYNKEYQCDFQEITVPEGTEGFILPEANALTTLNLPSTMVDFSFTYTDNFKDLYLHSVYPPYWRHNNKPFTNVNIHVPAMAMDLYVQTDKYGVYKSGNLVALEEPVHHVFVGWKDITIQNTEGLADDAQLTVPRWYGWVKWSNDKEKSEDIYSHNDGKAFEETSSIKGYASQYYYSGYQTAQLTVDAEKPVKLKKFRLDQDCGEYKIYPSDVSNSYYYRITPSTAIFNSPVTADEIEMTYHIFRTHLRWKGDEPNRVQPADGSNGLRFHLVSFPFDVRLSDIKLPPLHEKWNMKVFVMEFDGEKHATGSGTGYWRQLSGDEVLHANQGYLIDFYGQVITAKYYHGTYEGTETYDFEQTTLYLKAMDTENKQQILTNGDVSVPLTACPSKYKQRQGWNLIGNPYPCFFDIHHLNYTAPITVFDGFNYYAFSPIDDDYYLYPNEAFFVQCPDGVSSITFLKEGRLHNDPGGLWQLNNGSSQMPPRRRMPESDAARRVYNFMLNGEDGFDRARVVINEEASADYELERDAAKMAGQVGPQMYVLDGGVQYAIDERPLEDGTFTLGMIFPAKGSYVLSLKDNPDSRMAVMLTDNLTGTEVDLTETAYTFDAAAGNAADRFSVRIGAKMPTPVQDVSDHSCEPVYYDLQGRIVTEPSAMQKGVYILKQGQTTRKIVK